MGRKFISPTKTIFPSLAFHSDKPCKINVISNSPAGRKIKAWKFHEYILLIIVTGIFLFGEPSIQIKLQPRSLLFEDCQCVVER